MRKFVCEKLTKIEVREDKMLVTFERICLELSYECAQAIAAMAKSLKKKAL